MADLNGCGPQRAASKKQVDLWSMGVMLFEFVCGWSTQRFGGGQGCAEDVGTKVTPKFSGDVPSVDLTWLWEIAIFFIGSNQVNHRTSHGSKWDVSFHCCVKTLLERVTRSSVGSPVASLRLPAFCR